MSFRKISYQQSALTSGSEHFRLTNQRWGFKSGTLLARKGTGPSLRLIIREQMEFLLSLISLIETHSTTSTGGSRRSKSIVEMMSMSLFWQIRPMLVKTLKTMIRKEKLKSLTRILSNSSKSTIWKFSKPVPSLAQVSMKPSWRWPKILSKNKEAWQQKRGRNSKKLAN